MDLGEAFAALGIARDADATARRAAFDRQRTDLAEKVAAAATPNLAETYRRALARLTEAYEACELAADAVALPALRAAVAEAAPSPGGATRAEERARDRPHDEGTVASAAPAGASSSSGSGLATASAVVALALAVAVAAGAAWWWLRRPATPARVVSEPPPPVVADSGLLPRLARPAPVAPASTPSSPAASPTTDADAGGPPMVACQPTPSDASVAARTPVGPVELDIEPSSYGDRKPYDLRPDLEALLRAAGVELRAAGDAREVKAVIRASYAESEGAAYSAFGVGVGTSKGTNLSLRVEIAAIDERKPVTVEMSASTSSTVSVPLIGSDEPLFQDALSNLRGDEAFAALGDLVAAYLGQRAAQRRLHPALARPALRPVVEQVYGSAGYVADAPEARAYAAIGAESWDECVAVGGAAAAPLGDALSFIADSGDEQRLPLVEALARIADPRALPPLREELARHPAHEHDEAAADAALDAAGHEETEARLLQALLPALGAIDDPGVVADLAPYTRDRRDAVASAAREASARAWTRVPTRAAAGQPPTVALRVSASSWRDHRYDIAAALTGRLRALGVRVATDASVADGLVVVDYAERPGDATTTPADGGRGTAITCGVRVLALAGRFALAPIELSAATPENARADDAAAQTAAIAAFDGAPALAAAAELVAAAIGDDAAVARLLPRLDDAERAPRMRDLLAARGYRGSDDAARARIAVALGRFAEVERLGAAAAPALLAAVAEQRPGADAWRSPAGMRLAAAVFAGAGERGAVPWLGARLEELTQPDRVAPEEPAAVEAEAEAMRAMIAALGQLGDRAALPTLRKLVTDERQGVADAARAAVAQLTPGR